MRRVKKTTNEQFDLLKAEMVVHPAAARGYGVGAQRAIVDAEWKEIVEKLNALGPPQRTMTEWKKVWSDLRLRNIKRLSDEFTPKPKRAKYKSKRTKLLETLCSADSIYASYGKVSDQKSCSSSMNNDDESANENSYENPLAEEEVDTEKHYFNTSHNDNSYDLDSFREEEETAEICHDSKSNYNLDCISPHNTKQQTELSAKKSKHLVQTLSIIEQQMKNQNKIVKHLTQITSNLTMLMENHVVNLEKQNKAIEKQLRATESHNGFLRRQEARNTFLNKCKLKEFETS